MVSRPQAQWPEGREEPLAVAEWAPLVDISEDEQGIPDQGRVA